MNTLPDWFPRASATLGVLVILTPVFGWAAEAVGYTEPLENAAKETGAVGSADPVQIALMPEYSVSGLSMATGTLVSAVVGTALTLLIATLIGQFLVIKSDAE